MIYLTVLIKLALKKYMRKFKRIISENWSNHRNITHTWDNIRITYICISKAVILEFHISPFELKLDLEKFNCVIWAISNIFVNLRSLYTAKAFYALSTYFSYITVWFHETFFVYIGGVISQQETGQKGVKPLFSHRNFVQLLLPIRKK